MVFVLEEPQPVFYVNISVFDLSGKPAVKCFRAERLAPKSCQGVFFLLNILGSSPLEKWRTGLAPTQTVLSETMKDVLLSETER